jgi:hypothetical protein
VYDPGHYERTDPTMSGSDDAEFGYTEWRCENCGHSAPKNNPPCDRCGNMRFEQMEVHASDFDDEIRVAGTLELVRENARTVGAAVAILLVVAVVGLANAGVFVVADSFGLGYLVFHYATRRARRLGVLGDY